MSTGSIHTEEYRKLVKSLKELREERGLTQSELAAKLGEDQSFVSKYERRERRLDVFEVRQICAALGIEFTRFMTQWESAIASGESMPGNEPYDVLVDAPPSDADWDARDWAHMLDWFIDTGLVTHKEVMALVLGHLNPSQVGTSIATKKTFQSCFEKRKCWQAVRDWHFAQPGRCHDCNTRLELQADHIVPREKLGDAADRLENMTLRCRRCNVIRRPSHRQGGLTFLTAEAALMWLLFTKRPRTYQAFEELCRSYGMTMANIRFQEAWAMARWLAREGLYKIDPESKY